MKKVLYIVCLLLIVFPVVYGQNDGTSGDAATDSLSIGDHVGFTEQHIDYKKADADSAYMREDYATAIQIYESLLEQGESAIIYYNLGNSYYKSDNIGKAILNYERALLMRPGNGDIRANLEIARGKTVDKVDAIPEIFIVSWMKTLINTMSVNAWARWGVAFFFIFLAGLYFYIFSNRLSRKKAGFITGIVSLLFCLVSNIFAYHQKSALENRNTAIVTTPSITVRSTPSESGNNLFVLHEGAKVFIKDNTMREWKEIRLEDGKVGWVSARDIEVI